MFKLELITTSEDKFEASNITLRPSDIIEFTGASGKPWQKELSESISVSDLLWKGVNEKQEIVSVGGVVILPDAVIPWFAGTDKSKHEKRSWLEEGKKFVELLRTFEKPVINYVWNKNTKTIKWLERLGFVVEKNKEYEFYHETKFYKFYLGKRGK
tara:strand:+ start:115 stop:582 length:468 start_codon:yes stop_codon:yes gene_type:complete